MITVLDSATTVRSSIVAQGSGPRLILRHAEQPQHAVGQQIGGPDYRLQDLDQGLVNERGGQRELLRIERAHGLGRDLAEDDENHREETDADGGGYLATHLQADQGHDRGRNGVHEVVADEDESDQAVGTLEHAFGRTRAAAALAGEVAQPMAVDAHQRRLGGGEECGKRDQRDEDEGERRYRYVEQGRQPQCRPSSVSSTSLLPK